MFAAAPPPSAGRRRAAPWLAVQCALVVLVLAAAALSPRPGQAILLVPLAGSVAPLIGTGADRLPVRLVAPGRVPGSMIVHAQGDVPIVHLLMRGIVPLAALDGTCGQLATTLT